VKEHSTSIIALHKLNYATSGLNMISTFLECKNNGAMNVTHWQNECLT